MAGVSHINNYIKLFHKYVHPFLQRARTILALKIETTHIGLEILKKYSISR